MINEGGVTDNSVDHKIIGSNRYLMSGILMKGSPNFLSKDDDIHGFMN